MWQPTARSPKLTAPLAALLALAVVVAPMPAPAFADDDDPDLEVRYLGPGTAPEFQRFEVRNVGKEKSPKTTLTVRTLKPGPANEQRYDVPALDRGKSASFTYTLDGACDAHELKATVDLKKDEDPSNNTTQLTACDARPGPSSKPESKPVSKPVTSTQARDTGVSVTDGVLGPDDDNVIRDSGASALPEHLRKGEHLLTLEPTVLREHGLDWRDSGILSCFYDPDLLGAANVGYNFEDRAGCNQNAVSQLLIDFDTHWLKDQDKLIYRVHLEYDEEVILALNADRDDVRGAVGSCIGRIGLAPLGYEATMGAKQLLATESADAVRLTTGWDVTSDVRWATTSGNRFQGWVLHGRNENLTVESDGACASMVTNLRLRLHYAIL